MSVIETDKIDGVGKGEEKGELMLLITDHLDWANEQEHLMALQNKINSYLGFIESKQYEEIYPNDSFEEYVIEIHFKNGISENCFHFLDVVANQVEHFNVKIRAEVA